MKRITLTLSTLAVVGTLLTAMAFTLPARASDRKTASTTEQPWLPIPQIYAKLEAAGYRNIEKIEREHGTYEVRATDRQGARVRLDVHPQTGAILERGARRPAIDSAERRQRTSAECNERRCRDDMPAKAAKP
ncbi:MAG: PepSY domain-containing protein [Rhodoferax sp.]|nr:PepSY domain-containing protein [Rhodoferax sp.]